MSNHVLFAFCLTFLMKIQLVIKRHRNYLFFKEIQNSCASRETVQTQEWGCAGAEPPPLKKKTLLVCQKKNFCVQNRRIRPK